MKGGTLFSGIGAPECAAPWIDWRWCAEIDRQASVVHAARFPDVPNLGDVTGVEWSNVESDLVVFGSPCQAFSVAGKREGLDDPRGNLTLVGLAAIGRILPRWVVWENVPGVLSDDDGRTLGIILWTLGQLGYGFAYRVLDARYFGVPQNRRRVFLVGYLGDWRPSAAVLFERESLSWNPSPRRKAREGYTGTLEARTRGGGGLGTDFELNGGLVPLNDLDGATHALTSSGSPSGHLDPHGETFIAHTLRADGFDASEDGTGRGTPLVPIAFDARQSDACVYGNNTGALDTQQGSIAIAFSAKDHGQDAGPLSPTLRAGGHDKSHANAGCKPAVAFTVSEGANSFAWESENYPTLNATPPSDTSGLQYGIRQGLGVRRLTPRECERLQGFPDDWTLVDYKGKPMRDGPRYKMIGNSMAVPVMRWILDRIRMVDGIVK